MRIPHWDGMITFSLAIAVLAAVSWLAAGYKKLTSVTILTDHYLSPEIRNGIYALIKRYFLIKRKKLSAREVCGLVRNTYPSVNRIRITFPAQGRACISVTADKPQVLVNNTYVITRNGTVCPTSSYAGSALDDLFLLATPSIDTIQPEAASAFMKSLPPFIREKYDCVWHDKTIITLHDKLQPTIALKANSQTIIDERMIDAIKRLEKLILYRTHMARTNTSLSTGARWCIDVRCKNKLILAQQRERHGHQEDKRYA